LVGEITRMPPIHLELISVPLGSCVGKGKARQQASEVVQHVGGGHQRFLLRRPIPAHQKRSTKASGLDHPTTTSGCVMIGVAGAEVRCITNLGSFVILMKVVAHMNSLAALNSSLSQSLIEDIRVRFGDAGVARGQHHVKQVVQTQILQDERLVRGKRKCEKHTVLRSN
jgi:hypothetical protein